MIIGGGMAYTFLKIDQGVAIGNSLFDEEVRYRESVCDQLLKSLEYGMMSLVGRAPRSCRSCSPRPRKRASR